jgi:hypothetical protein
MIGRTVLAISFRANAYLIPAAASVLVNEPRVEQSRLYDGYKKGRFALEDPMSQRSYTPAVPRASQMPWLNEKGLECNPILKKAYSRKPYKSFMKGVEYPKIVEDTPWH